MKCAMNYNEKLTDHFSFKEICYTSHKDLAETNLFAALQMFEDIQRLAWFAEQIRAFLGVPMMVTSGFRCRTLNDRVRGSASSQHLYAQAIDFIPKGMSIDDCFKMLKSSKLVYGQLIKECSGKSEWIHVGMGHKRENLIYKDGQYTRYD